MTRPIYFQHIVNALEQLFPPPEGYIYKRGWTINPLTQAENLTLNEYRIVGEMAAIHQILSEFKVLCPKNIFWVAPPGASPASEPELQVFEKIPWFWS
ncbi:hypothetical protein BO82DRAFT_407710 [Aspergillus uvarum CBS 121591]|uniref:Uncharacterized protein n=1 Tax=Aspergillus uvarum CBS 121591 TaxID=1448315 RepID=A0A319CBB6_9EURO|nr:hypothetical protein BO82DRAFT_407710 [Aspergillus uvarum CBS 121591]PYH75813.1 hypothetical protein BO82DRAFT_407710 [Aspergillus uvarum CBS 121591]